MRLSNCDRCYRRKSKCDRLKPCSSCLRANVSCTYPNRPARPKSRHQTPTVITRSASTSISRWPHQLSQGLSHTASGGPRAGPISEVSFLSLDAAGERRSYLGSSSGVLFADLVQSALDATVTRSASPESVTRSSETSVVTHSRRVDDLPPRAAAEALIHAYIHHEAIIYPIMLPGFLTKTLQRFYNDPGYHTTRATAFEVFSFHMVLAIAMERVQKYRWHFEVGPEWFNTRAMAESSSVFAGDSLERLQSILLLCQYRSCSPIRDNSASMWHLLGVAARLCIELGLHREPSYPFSSVGVDAPPEMIDRYQRQEIKRRCFWTFIAMDRIVSIILGRPFALHDDDIDTSLPSEESDQVMSPANEMLGCTRISVSNKIFRYRLLCGRISLRFHRRKSEGLSGDDAARATQCLADQLEEWYRSSPQLYDLQQPIDGEENISCYLSPEWYDLLKANASLMLWRPYFSQPELSRNYHVLDQIFGSASSAIAIYADLLRSRKINYNSITLQSVFMAGLSYLSTVSQHFRQRRSAAAFVKPLLSCDISLGDVIRATRACSGVLVAIGDRWNLPRHCREVFDRLSDAVLADAMQCDSAVKQALTHDRTVNAAGESTGQATVLSTTSHNNNYASRSTTAQSPSDDQLDGLNSPQASLFIGAAEHPSTLTMDNDFMNCFGDIQRLCDDQYLDDSVMQLSHDWLGSLAV